MDGIARNVEPYQERLARVETVLASKPASEWLHVTANGKPKQGLNMELEKLAALLLADHMGQRTENNPDEYVILSDRQMQSRQDHEMPFDLTLGNIIMDSDGVARLIAKEKD